MSGLDLPRELLETAKSDLRALQHMLDSTAFDDRVFGFHAQQAVEKELKAWLNRIQGTHPYTHDLSLLLSALTAIGADVDPYWDFLDLSGYAVRFRYETRPEGEEAIDREDLLNDVSALVTHVEALLSGV